MYRIHEAVMHYAEAIKAIMSEELGAPAARPRCLPRSMLTACRRRNLS